MDEGEATDRMAGLVPLQRADQVPLDRDVRELILLGERFLHPVFADDPESGGTGGTNRLGPVRLGDSDDSHRMTPSPERLVPADRLAHEGQPARKLRERHNPQI